MSYFWISCTFISCIFCCIFHTGAEVTAGVLDGAVQGIQLAIRIAGPLCLWSGIGALMERCGLCAHLSRLFAPLLRRLFPQSRENPTLAGYLSANFCANLLGLGNAATPMGIQAAGLLRDPVQPDRATDPLCRLVVLNTASIQLLPTTVAVLRRSAGCQTPFDLLPCVWVTSVLSVSAGLTAAYFLQRRWRDV